MYKLFPKISVLFLLLWSSFFVSTCALASETINLQFNDLENYVRSKNLNISGARLFTEAAEKRTGSLTRSFLPHVDLFGGVEHFQTGILQKRTDPYYGVEAKANLYRGGKDSLESEIRKQQVIASQSFERKVITNELTEARKVFWDLVFTRELANSLKVVLEQNESNLQSAIRRISRGLSAQTDRLEFEINRSELKVEIESLEHESLILQIKLSSALGLPSTTQFITPTSIPHEHHEEEMQMSSNPEAHQDVASLRSNQAVAELHSRVNRRWWTPSLDVYSQYVLYTMREKEHFSRRERDEYVLGVRLTLNVFDGFQERSTASAFAIQAEAYENQAQQRARSLFSEFRVSQEVMKHEHELIHEAEDRIKQVQTYYRNTLDEYSRGVKNSPDVLNASQKLLTIQKKYAELRRDYQFARADLLAKKSVIYD